MKASLLFSVLLFTFFVTSASASPYRYMDEAGTIHFADSLSEIPTKYQYQVITPLPTPDIDSKEWKRHLKEQKRKEKTKKKIRTPRPTRTPKPTKTPRGQRPKSTPVPEFPPTPIPAPLTPPAEMPVLPPA